MVFFVVSNAAFLVNKEFHARRFLEHNAVFSRNNFHHVRPCFFLSKKWIPIHAHIYYFIWVRRFLKLRGPLSIGVDRGLKVRANSSCHWIDWNRQLFAF